MISNNSSSDHLATNLSARIVFMSLIISPSTYHLGIIGSYSGTMTF